MATYPVKHKETGETKDVVMSIHEWDKWKEENPEWERYYTPDNVPGVGVEVGDMFNKLYTKHPGWKDVIGKVKNNQVQILNTTINFMPKKKAGIGSTNPVPFGMSNKMMKRKKPINLDFIKKIGAITDNQQVFFDKYKRNRIWFAYGCAGTGKTFITLYNAIDGCLRSKDTIRKDLHRQVPCTHQRDWIPPW